MQSVSDYFQYTFGDIISFPKGCSRVKKAYKHFAVYVGTKNLFGQGEDKDTYFTTYVYVLFELKLYEKYSNQLILKHINVKIL